MIFTAFLSQFWSTPTTDMPEVNTTATTQTAGEFTISTLLGGKSAPHTTGQKHLVTS